MRTLLFLLPLSLHAQTDPGYAAAAIPKDLLENADAVVRSREVTFTVKAADEAVLHEKRAVTILNRKSAANLLVLFYDGYNRIGTVGGKVYDASGNPVRELEKNEINDISYIQDFSIYEDSRVRYVEVNHDRYPYTIVFEYDIKYKALRGYPDWNIQDFNTAVENASYTLVLPSGLDVSHRSVNIDLPPVERQGSGRRFYEWTVKNLKAVKKESDAPPSRELLPAVLVSPGLFKTEEYTGSMSSWQNFGKFLYKLAEGRDDLSKTMRAKVRVLTAGAATDAEKIAALYRFLQENTRYVSVQLGIGGWQPYDAQYVEKNKYGDCKALSNYMKALLREAGIEAYPVLVKHGDDHLDLPDDFVMSNAFNHMILYVPGQDTWLECTSTSLPPGYLGSGTDDREVLLITPEGGKLARTPPLSPAENTARRRIEVTIQADGGASIDVRTRLHGALHEWYRHADTRYSPDELQKEMQKKNPLPQAYFTKLAIRAEKEKPEAAVDYVMNVPQFGSKAGKRLFIPLNPVSPFTDVPAAGEGRVHPVSDPDGYTEQDTIVLHLPENFSVESVPAETAVPAGTFGAYSIRFVQEGQTLTCIRQLEIKPVRLPAARYGEWRNFRRDIAKADGMKVVLVNKT